MQDKADVSSVSSSPFCSHEVAVSSYAATQGNNLEDCIFLIYVRNLFSSCRVLFGLLYRFM